MRRSPFNPVVSYIQNARPAATTQRHRFGKSAPVTRNLGEPDWADSAFPGAKQAKAKLKGKPIRPKRRRRK